MRVINKSRSFDFRPNRLPLYVRGIKTKEIDCLRLLTSPIKICFESKPSDRSLVPPPFSQHVLDGRLTHDPSKKPAHWRVRYNISDPRPFDITERRPQPRSSQATRPWFHQVLAQIPNRS